MAATVPPGLADVASAGGEDEVPGLGFHYFGPGAYLPSHATHMARWHP